MTLTATIEPQFGLPCRVRIATTIVLDAGGLVQTAGATNQSDSRAPYGTGPHP